MRFITEIELRNEYRQHPFEIYHLTKVDRLTSEAKQFLQDRQVKIVLEDKLITSKKVKGRTEDNQKVTKSFNLKAQLLYINSLQVILLAKNQCSEICEELYSISLIIKQFSSDKEKEISLKMPNETDQMKQENLTLDQLFSQNGELLVSILSLATQLNLFMIEYVENLTIEEQKQLEILSLRLSNLTAHLIGE